MKIYSLLFLLITTFTFAQIPAGYYNSATGTGYILKTQLHQIITNSHQPQAYNTHWTFFEAYDVLPNGKVWDIYANCNFNFGTPDNGGNQDIGTGGNVECQFFNREHTFPTSWFGNIEPTRSDIIQVLPVDKKVNNERGNLPYGEVTSAIFTSTNGSKRGANINSSVSGQAFEVIDEYKGDIARIFFYMATRYENLIASWENLNADGDKMLDGSSNKVFEQWALDMLYQWHIQDPVSQKEINRNNGAYIYQNNRNPFIDNPQWVANIWGNNLTTNVPAINWITTVYPNPSVNGEINITSSIEISNIEIYSLHGQQLINISDILNTSFNLSTKNLNKGMYLINIKAQNYTEVKKLIIN